MVKVPTGVQQESGFWRLEQPDSSFSLDFLPILGLFSSDFTMNVQACSRCGHGVYPAEKINCLDQVSRHFLAFADCHKLGKYILSHMDRWFFLSHQDMIFSPLFFSSTHFQLHLLYCLKKKKNCEFYHHFIPKAHFFFFCPEIYKIPENERKCNFAQSFLFGFQIWHKACFHCEVCKMMLSVNNFVSHQKKPYCHA